MAFLNPILLLGTLGIAVPIIIHLLNRFKSKQMDWAAMELLRRAMVARSKKIQIEDILMLLLRCLAVLLLALAMARPTIQTLAGKWFGAEEQVGVVIALDASFSMAHCPGMNSRFERGRQHVREIFRTLQPGNPVSLVLLGQQPRILLRNVGYDEERFTQKLQELEALPESLNLERCLSEMETLVREIRAPVRECYLITDAQRTSWENWSDKAKVKLENIHELAKTFYLTTTAQGSENVALERLEVASGMLRVGSTARLVAEVRNHGQSPQEEISLNLFLNGNLTRQRIVERIEPYKSVTVPLLLRLEDPGPARITVRLGPDPLRMDNERHLVINVREHLRVLCIDGDPSEEPYKNETDFLRTALHPREKVEEDQTLSIRTVPWLELSTQRLQDHDVVVLANVPEIHNGQVAMLRQYVFQGGGLMVFLGDQVKPEAYNTLLKIDDKPLLPGKLKEPQGEINEDAEGWKLNSSKFNHPSVKVLGTLSTELLAAVQVIRYFPIEPDETARPILTLAGTGDPFISEKQIGRGRVMLIAAPANREWSNLVVHPLYPILAHQMVAYLTRPAHERSWIVGEAIAIPLPKNADLTNITFQDPRGEQVPLQPTERDGMRMVEYPTMPLPGFSEVIYSKEAPPMVLAGNLDRRESNTVCLEGKALTGALQELPIKHLDAGDNLATVIKESRVGRELWRILMMLGLLVLLVEGYLARRFTGRIPAREAHVTTLVERPRRAAKELLKT